MIVSLQKKIAALLVSRELTFLFWQLKMDL
jgi:hypothetical protein